MSEKNREEKKSLRQKLSETVWKPAKNEGDVIEKKMASLGVSILSDRKLEHRIDLLREMQRLISSEIKTDDLAEYVEELKSRLTLLNDTIYSVAAPYARSGDLPRFGRMLHGWSRLYASASSWILRTEDTIEKKHKKKGENGQEEADSNDAESSILEHGAIDKRMHVRFLHDVLQKHIFKDGFLILGACFLDKDVSERAATVVQTVINPTQGLKEGMPSQGSDEAPK